MKYFERKDAILLLQDGTVFEGKAVGKIGSTSGEICFNTGMSGYQEIFTDPSYYGQLMLMNNVHIGNYGILDEEAESNGVKIAGLICKSFSNVFSRKRSHISLQEYFEKHGIVGISDVDTRAIVQHIRDKGAMNAIVSSETTDVNKLKEILASTPSMEGLELSSKVSTTEKYVYGSINAKYKVAALDFGIKENILRSLAERDCCIDVYPFNTDFAELQKSKANGYFLSNGPGDPGAMPKVVSVVKDIIASGKPVFGICLGHQLIAEASGVATYKMHHGHRGINHPVKNVMTGKCEITSQNHGFAVKEEEVKKHSNIEITHLNLNDNTIEGLRLKDKQVFSVQYHPEAAPGPHDSRYLFDDFVTMLSSN